MSNAFSAELDASVRRSRLPLRRVATRADIPHQTLFNWVNGSQPRWHPGLQDDLRRLALSLGLDGVETDYLLQAAGCLPARTMARHTKEAAVERSSLPPKHWTIAGSHPADYEVGVDTTASDPDRRYAYVRSLGTTHGFGTLMQTFDARAFRNKRLRFKASVSSVDVEHWAGLWMRVDGPSPLVPLAFDNMENRPITGTLDWKVQEVVLDIAPRADKVAFGVLLAGRGEVRIADLDLAPVEDDVATTGGGMYPTEPMNLSLSD